MECVKGELWATIQEWLLLSIILGPAFFWLILPYSRNELGLKGWAQFRHFVKTSFLLGFIAILIALLVFDERYCSYA